MCLADLVTVKRLLVHKPRGAVAATPLALLPRLPALQHLSVYDTTHPPGVLAQLPAAAASLRSLEISNIPAAPSATLFGALTGLLSLIHI